MAADPPPIYSPLWWLDRLDTRLADRHDKTGLFDRYYEGEHRLLFSTSRFETVFGNLFEGFSDNWCDLVVDAVEERLNVEGFRFPTDSDSADAPPSGDEEAWRIWQENGLDAGSQMAHLEALIHGESAALVWPDPTRDGRPQITVEHPHQMIVDYDPATRQRRAALKRWTSDDGYQHANVYLPAGIYKYRSRTQKGFAEKLHLPRGVAPAEWIVREDAVRNPWGIVPVVPLPNRPRLARPGRSEIAKVVPLQDAVNKTIVDMLVASEFEGFRQRWATGLITDEDEEGNVVDQFQHAIDRLWSVAETDAKFGEFGSHDLSNFVAAVEMLVQHIASQTRTPPHYFYLRGEFPSGETIKSAETGLVAKTYRKMRFFGEGWEDVIRLAFRILDDRRSDVVAAETIWSDPESRSESEHVDALIKLAALGVPLPALWEKAGFTPTEIRRFRELRAAEAQLGPPPDPAPPNRPDDAQ